MRVSVLGFGGSEIGYGNASVETVSRLLGSALDAGLNVIDTAECYLTSESLIGEAVSHRRQDYYLFTKCGHSSDYNSPDWSRKSLESSIDRSLRRLRTNYLDLIQLHSCGEEILRQGVVIEVLQQARDKGKTRYIGYSGDNDAALYAINCGAFDTLQTSINIADQKAITLTVPAAKDKGMGIIAKRPIANAVWKYRARPQDPYIQPYWERLLKLDYPFLRTEAKTVAEIALKFTLSIPGVHTAIVGTIKPGRWQQNMEILETGLLAKQHFESIRTRWMEVAAADWASEV